MRIRSIILPTVWVADCFAASTDGEQTAKPVRNVAIIGAGAAGSSAAYYLHKYAKENDLGINITLFEKTDRIGGRTLTINPFGSPLDDVELGASIFIQLNAILYNATREFGLNTISYGEDGVGGILAVWDGDKVLFHINNAHSSWRTAARMLWRFGYGALKNSQSLMQKTIAKFLNLYQAPYFPFESLTQRTHELGLLDETSMTGEEFLQKNNIPHHLSHGFIQAMTRVNYASNLAHIHGLETMVAMAPEGAMSVVGGNWRIFHKMVQASGASALLNTSVASIALDSKDSALLKPKYVLKTLSSGQAVGNAHPILFDEVIIAAPYQFSKVTAADGVIEKAIDEIPYIKLHVTIFASPFRLSASYFKVPSGSQVPTTILTTLAEGEEPTAGIQGAGKAGFYSISTLRTIVNPDTDKEEYLYKVFSPEEVTPEFLSNLLGVRVPHDFVGQTEKKNGEAEGVKPISWFYPHVFHSYPKAFPRVTFQDPILRAGLYYTGGMESFISTMETNALMGMNVARLIVDDMLGLKTGKAVIQEASDADEDQTVLKEL